MEYCKGNVERKRMIKAERRLVSKRRFNRIVVPVALEIVF